MAKGEVLVPVFLHNTGFPRAFLFVSAVRSFFSNGIRMEVLAGETQHRIRQQPLE